jgi:hypothetical protein
MVSRILLIVTGLNLNMYELRIHAMSVEGIVISAGFVAFRITLFYQPKCLSPFC